MVKNPAGDCIEKVYGFRRFPVKYSRFLEQSDESSAYALAFLPLQTKRKETKLLPNRVEWDPLEESGLTDCVLVKVIPCAQKNEKLAKKTVVFLFAVHSCVLFLYLYAGEINATH